MKYILFFVLFVVAAFKSEAQEKHFVFIQTENRQPFYVSLNGKIYSSTASGYVIIPKLNAGDYKFSVGFAGGSNPEQVFSYTIDNKDVGFSLKNFGEKGWGLFNYQTMAVTMAGEVKVDVAKSAAAKRDDPEPIISFDKKPEIAPQVEKPVVSAEQAITAITKAPEVNLKDTIAVETKPIADIAMVEAKEVIDTVKKKTASSVSKVSEVSAAENVSLTYVDGEGKTKDTVQVIIPTADVVQSSSKTDTITKAVVTSNEKPTEVKNARDERVSFLNIDSAKTEAAPAKEAVILNSNCNAKASDEDYTKLRRKMAHETTDEAMMAEASKFYQKKCFSTAQVKALSTLFLSDEGRYKFFEASLNFVTDPDQYQTLTSEFIDPEFVKRFKGFLNK